MLILVSYDVSTTSSAGRKRLRRTAKACEDFGLRVQNSVFECNVDPARWEVLKTRLMGIVNKDQDSLRFYFLGSNWERKVEHHGAKKPPDLGELIIV
ncbi:MAG TPA: CRISPR-associated endonuclease Cas2 [Fibrobacteria bacterium]|nr:CRISPR-associated endonuclease Cas2 [Fibrobacteria bacterium]